jgi:hypothetical protein
MSLAFKATESILLVESEGREFYFSGEIYTDIKHDTKMTYREVYLIKFSEIKVSDATKVHVSHVVTVDVHDFLAGQVDLTTQVVLGLLLYITKFIESIEPVLLVMELDLTCQLMCHSSHE